MTTETERSIAHPVYDLPGTEKDDRADGVELLFIDADGEQKLTARRYGATSWWVQSWVLMETPTGMAWGEAFGYQVADETITLLAALASHT